MGREKHLIPTAGIRAVEKNGFHRKIPVRSFFVGMTEIGGSEVKAVRIDSVTSWEQARVVAEAENPGWRFKGSWPLMDRDFKEGEQI